MMRPSLALLAVLVAAAAPSARASDPPRTGTAVLACGPARLVARTTSVAHVGADDGLAWTAQAITLAAGPGDAGRPIPVKGVEARTAPGSSGGLTAIVSSWACLSGTRGKVIELWLSCNRTDLGGACRGEREWERLLDTTGRPLDGGYAPQDPRYEALSARLGIPTDDVQLEAATGD